MSDDWGNDPLVGAPTSDAWGNDPLNSSNNGGQSSVGVSPVGGSSSAPSQSWGSVAADAAGNLIPSAEHVAEGVYSAVRHPVDTATAMANVGRGAGQELAHSIRGDQNTHNPTDQEKAFEGVKSYFGNRYGSVDGFKSALATDPVGVATDLSVLLSGGESAASKIPALSKASTALGSVADVANPVTAVAGGIGKVVKPLGNAAAKFAGDVTTGAGSNSVKEAFKAGVAGGDASKAFTGNMRGDIPWDQVVTDAKTGLANMRSDRNAAYRSGMTDISKDATVLSFDPIDKALAKAGDIKTYSGRSGTGPVQDLSPKTASVHQEIADTLNNWKGLDPAEYHTPEGFDALKQQLGDIKDAQQFGTPQRTIANDAYNVVRNTISKQAPAYNKVMSDYSKASDQLSVMQKELSLGPKGNPNTALRKLQSVMRDNANTSWGKRADYANTLADNGAPNLMPALAGQALSTAIPRGLAKYSDLGMMGAAGLAHLPAALAAGLISSPRLVGEAAHGLGSAVRSVTPAAKTIAPGAAYIADKAPIAYEAGDVQELSPPDDPTLSNATNILENIASPAPKFADGGHVHAAASEVNQSPTDGQIEAGNYKKGHVTLHGFDLTIETPQGAARRGFGANGAMWENRHPTAHYGYIKKTVGADDEHVDAYIGPDHASTRIFVVNQFDPSTKKFDEHKLVFGAKSPKQARAIYDGGFSDGSGPKRRWAVHEIDPAGLKAWLASGRTKRPFPARLAA